MIPTLIVEKTKLCLTLPQVPQLGAVNAAILVDNVIHPQDENADNSKIWSDAVDTLGAFYAKISERDGNMHPMWWVDNVFLNNSVFDSFGDIGKASKHSTKLKMIYSSIPHLLLTEKRSKTL